MSHSSPSWTSLIPLSRSGALDFKGRGWMVPCKRWSYLLSHSFLKIKSWNIFKHDNILSPYQLYQSSNVKNDALCFAVCTLSIYTYYGSCNLKFKFNEAAKEKLTKWQISLTWRIYADIYTPSSSPPLLPPSCLPPLSSFLPHFSFKYWKAFGFGLLAIYSTVLCPS